VGNNRVEPATIEMSEPTDPPPQWQRRSPLGWALMTVSLALVFGLLGLLVYRVAQGNPGKGLVASIRDGKKPLAPEFSLNVLWAHTETWDASARWALRDNHVSLSELRGKPVVLNFWASWCVPCSREAPRLAASATVHRGGVLFLGLDVKDFSGDARKFLRKHKANYVSVRDGGSWSYNAYGLTGLPETYFLDSRGHIVSHVLGEISRAQLENGIETVAGSQ
jgi:cytochrome c biogenesis protein CcmG, thiol:disulfide interchange protein DsbE